MNKKLEKKIVLTGPYEDVISLDHHFYLKHKLNRICVLPYTISSDGLLDKIGVIKQIDLLEEKENYILINNFNNQDDPTNLVAANRLIYEIIGSNIKNADNWMYLGKINNTSISSDIIIYAVNISNIDINDDPEVNETKQEKKFQLIDSNKVVTSDDALFLSAYLRLFHFFFVQSLIKK